MVGAKEGNPRSREDASRLEKDQGVFPYFIQAPSSYLPTHLLSSYRVVIRVTTCHARSHEYLLIPHVLNRQLHFLLSRSPKTATTPLVSRAKSHIHPQNQITTLLYHKRVTIKSNWAEGKKERNTKTKGWEFMFFLFSRCFS